MAGVDRRDSEVLVTSPEGASVSAEPNLFVVGQKVASGLLVGAHQKAGPCPFSVATLGTWRLQG